MMIKCRKKIYKIIFNLNAKLLSRNLKAYLLIQKIIRVLLIHTQKILPLFQINDLYSYDNKNQRTFSIFLLDYKYSFMSIQLIYNGV